MSGVDRTRRLAEDFGGMALHRVLLSLGMGPEPLGVLRVIFHPSAAHFLKSTTRAGPLREAL